MRRMTLVLIVALGAHTTARATLPEECGDADQNGTLSVTDGVRVLRTAADLADGCAIASRCDIDGNGAITVSDGVAALKLAAGLPATVACEHTIVDRSDFVFFTFFARSAFGYCPALGGAAYLFLSVRNGEITRDAAVIVEGNPGDPDCLSDIMTVPPVACAREVMLPARVLTADEGERVRNVFSAVERERLQNPDCKRVDFAPCLLNEFTWDNNFQITDFICGQPRLLPDQSAALISVLDSLL